MKKPDSETSDPIHALQLGMGWFPEQPGNGLDRVYHALMRHLPQVGVAVDGLVTGSENVGRSSAYAARAFAPATAPLPKRLWRLRRAVRDGYAPSRYDVVASHFALYTLPVLDLLRSCPLVIHFHGPWAWESGAEGERALKIKVKAVLERIVYRRGRRFIVLSRAFRDVLTQEYGVPAEQVRIVPGGVEAARFDTGRSKQEARAHLGWPQERSLILSVRRLVRRVGLENLVAAMERVRTSVPEALLLVAGKGPLRGELEARIRAADLGRHVRLLGFVPDEELPLAYRAADVSVVPSVALEGFGLVAAESLAAGTPALVTPVGGLPEVVHGLSERLVLPDARPETMGEHLIAAFEEAGGLPSAEACRHYARSHFDWPVIAAQVRDVYEEVL